MILIISCGTGNISSIANMIQKTGGKYKICTNPSDISKANKILLPGVGAFDHGMNNLSAGGWINALNEAVIVKNIPVLGICLGMQLMCKSSEEGSVLGLGWIDADVKRFDFSNTINNLKIPHMGWNTVSINKQNPLIEYAEEKQRFYFVHSYHAVCHNEEDILATTNYGYDFVCAFSRGNVFGTQFHPEKSHSFGMELIRKFVEL